jgi:hypothetical protein
VSLRIRNRRTRAVHQARPRSGTERDWGKTWCGIWWEPYVGWEKLHYKSRLTCRKCRQMIKDNVGEEIR